MDDVAEPIARAATRRLSAAGPGELRIVFGGDPNPGGRQYFRLAGPDDLFEYQNLGQHIHSLWRSRHDFGR